MKQIKLTILILLIGICLPVISTAQEKVKSDLAHTFSIIAYDSATGEMAVGVQSHWFAVGTIVSWAKSGVGVVATQSFVNPAYGQAGIEKMESGANANTVLQSMVEADAGRDFRQVAMLDVKGNIAVYTGKKCIEYASHYKGANYSVQANMMLNDRVIPAMSEAFEASAHRSLEERILLAMKAAQSAGGDIRGKQSAALILVGPELEEREWVDKKIDLRIDDSTDPIGELERLLKVHKAYEFMNKGDLAIEKGDMALALEAYAAAEALMPDNLEMKYWKAVALANNNRLHEALPIFKSVFEKDINWKELTRRLPEPGLLELSEEDLRKVLSL